MIKLFQSQANLSSLSINLKWTLMQWFFIYYFPFSNKTTPTMRGNLLWGEGATDKQKCDLIILVFGL